MGCLDWLAGWHTANLITALMKRRNGNLCSVVVVGGGGRASER